MYKTSIPIGNNPTPTRYLQGIVQDDLRGVSIPYFFDSMNKHESNQNRCTVYLSNNIQLTGAHKGIVYSYVLIKQD